MFRSLGATDIEFLALDEERQSDAELEGFDTVYLSGGDPVIFRQHLRRTGMAERLRTFIATGRLVMGASGGAMQLGANVSVFRLLSESVDDIVANAATFDGLHSVDFGFLPHLNRHGEAFLEKVRKYSESVHHDIVAVNDGAAVAVSSGNVTCLGRGIRWSRGIKRPMGDL